MGRIYDATWGRAFAAFYDPMVRGSEEAGLREMRRELLTGARGRTLDVGAGTGANLPLYPDAVSELILVEPSPHMARRLRRKLAAADTEAELLQAPAESLPLEDSSVDTVVFTLVLCTIPDPAQALSEAARVLRPAGNVLFLEHVRSRNPAVARWQDRLETPWHLFNSGCRCNRETQAALEASALEVVELERGRTPKAPAIVSPLIRGTARLPA